MQFLLILVVSLLLLYLLGLVMALLVLALILRQKLRKYQEDGRFGY